MASAIVYTETVVHAAHEPLVAEAPYQIAIVTFEDGNRLTVRINGERVAIGDAEELAEERDGVKFFRKVD